MMNETPPRTWSFYGRQAELAALGSILSRGRFFFLRVTGRRRIGKTTLVLQALRVARRDKIAYIQVSDADPAGVVAGAREHLRLSGVDGALPSDLQGLAATVGRLVQSGWIVVLDEYQVFARRPLYPFNSAMQYEVDRLRAPDAPGTVGGLILLGSIQTEMDALLSGYRAPLFGRVTDVLRLDHLAPSETAYVLARHGRLDGARFLFFWTLLQGVPKYWRDAYEVDALGASRTMALERMFFSGTAPLSAEGSSWLLEELRGRYDPLLRYLARCPGSSRADLNAHVLSVAGHTDPQVGAWLSALEERFGLVKRRNPALTPPNARAGRYYIDDGFLTAWLGALSDPVAFIGVREVSSLVTEADKRLATVEGFSLERLVAELYHERSVRGVGDFPVSDRVQGWWDRVGAEVDFVAQDAASRRLRVGSCKRSPEKLIGDLSRFDGHIQQMMKRHTELADWSIEKVAIAPQLDDEQRLAIQRAGYLPQDLTDLLHGLGETPNRAS